MKGRVDDMSKVTCIPLLAVANVEEAGVPQRPEAELVDDGAMSMIMNGFNHEVRCSLKCFERDGMHSAK